METRSIDLGQHILEIFPDQAITITSEAFTVELDTTETYRLLSVLQDLFHMVRSQLLEEE